MFNVKHIDHSTVGRNAQVKLKRVRTVLFDNWKWAKHCRTVRLWWHADCVSASSLVAGAGVLIMPNILDA